MRPKHSKVTPSTITLSLYSLLIRLSLISSHVKYRTEYGNPVLKISQSHSKSIPTSHGDRSTRWLTLYSGRSEICKVQLHPFLELYYTQNCIKSHSQYRYSSAIVGVWPPIYPYLSGIAKHTYINKRHKASTRSPALTYSLLSKACIAA